MDSLTTIYEGRVPLPGGGTAIYNYSGVAWYRHADWLGSSRFGSTPTQTLYNDLAFAPFGEVYASTGSTDESFAGNNEDTSAALYDAQNREYGIQGRWPSPDPAGIGAANPANPQSWNRYAYVMNNPLVFTDPSGFGTGGCFVAGRQGGGVSNYGNCGTGDGPFCDIIGELPCVGSDGGGGGDFSGGFSGGGQSVCAGEPLYQTCYIFNFGGGVPSGGDLCDGGDCFGSGPGGPAPPCLAGAGPLAPGQSYCAPQTPTPPQAPPQAPNKPCSGTSRAASAIEGLDSLGDAVISGNLAAVHFGAAFLLVSGGCLDPTPFEPLTCGAAGFGAVAVSAGGVALTGISIFETKRAYSAIKQAVTCGPGS